MPDWLFLRAGLWRSSCHCVKVTVGKSWWWWLFCCCWFWFGVFFSLMFFRIKKLQEHFVRRSLCANCTPQICTPGLGSNVCSLLVCAGGPLPLKVLQVTLSFSEPRTWNIADVVGTIFLALWATSQNSGLPDSQLVPQCTTGEGCCVLLAGGSDSDSQECSLSIGGQG